MELDHDHGSFLDDVELVDLHTHVLHGIDDGPWNEMFSLEMLRVAATDGIRTVVATPHAHHIRDADIPARIARLNEAAAAANVPVQVLPGSEVRIAPGIVDLYHKGELLTLNGSRWLLLELYLHDDWPRELIERSVGRLHDAGLRVVLSHAERYPFVQRDPSAVGWLVECGVLVQLNAGSLAGYHGPAAQSAAEAMLRSHHARLIASDAHNHERRAPRIRAALERAAGLTSPAYARGMALDAARIVADEDVTSS